MKKSLSFVLVVLIIQANAQISNRNFLGSKYTLEAVQKVLVAKEAYKPYPQTVAQWTSALPDTLIANTIKAGEMALNFSFEPIPASVAMDFVRSGDRERHANISYPKRNKLIDLLLAESMEDKGRFTEAIMNAVWSICEESYWGVPAHISQTGLPNIENPIVDLFTAETASVLALADYFVGDKLDKINPLIRKRIYHETNVRLFFPMMDHGDTYGWMSKTKSVNNWNPWIMSNWMMSNLLLEKDAKRRAEMLYASMKGLDLYINGLGEDGGCDEGPSYWFAAGGSVYDCLELLQHASSGQLNIFDKPLIQKMASYVYKAHIDGYYFTNFADADPVLRPDGLMLFRFGNAIKDPQLQQLGQWAFQNFPNTATPGYQRMRKLENLLTVKSMGNTNTYQPVKDAWVSDIQVMTARTSKGLYLASHGGHNAESHNHNDVGDFIVYANGQPMIVDAGRGNYTARTFSSKRYELWFTQSEYHNLPIVNGIGQKAGREFEAKSVTTVINDKEATLKMDIAAAYPKEAGMLQWNRTVSLNRAKNFIEIKEDYALENKPNSLQQIFMTICEVDISTAGKIMLKGDQNVSLQITYDAAKWAVASELPSSEGMEYKSFKTKWGGKKVVRIVLTNKAPTKKGEYSFRVE